MVLIVLAAAVVLTTAGFAVFRGFGAPTVPSGNIAIVKGSPTPPGEDVTKAQYQRALLQAVPRLGLRAVPKPGTAQYAQVKNSAISDLLLEHWIEGEAADRGITVSTSQVQDQLQQIIKTQFGNSQKQFQSFLKQSHYTPQDALERVRLQIISQQVQSQVLPKNAAPISTDQAKNYYEANIAQFQQPQTRDFRLVLNKDKAKVQQAMQKLQADDSTANWNKVAKQYSTDPTTKSTGGLRTGVPQGQSEPPLDKALFSSPLHQIVGPIKGTLGYYVIEVEANHPGSTQPFTKVQSQIEQQLKSLQQQQVATNFQNEFTSKWTAQTYCADGYVTDRCENFEPPPTSTGGGAVVPSIKPVQPGHAAVFFTAPTGLPQGPITQPGAAAPTIPGGSTIPLGPAGAPTTPGAAPPGAPPPGG